MIVFFQYYTITQLHNYTFTKKEKVMTINQFLAKANEEKKIVTISTTAIRTFIKENKADLEKFGIVQFIKKPNSLCIDIIKTNELAEMIHK